MTAMLRTLVATLLVTVVSVPVLRADVLSVDVTERHAIADGSGFGDTGAYEELVGRITFGIDPADPRNQVIVNLDRAPLNADGLVEATADLRILTPADSQRGNGVALVDVSNRTADRARFQPGRQWAVWRRISDARGLYPGLGRLGIRRAGRA